MLTNPNWRQARIEKQESRQLQCLTDLIDTAYGDVNPNGVYDVDDDCYVLFDDGTDLSANWRTTFPDDISVKDSEKKFELGLCPDWCYWDMIQDAVDNLKDDQYWQEQKEKDLWIQRIVQNM